MYYVVKKVSDCLYWWNSYYKRWEGLKDNATVFEKEWEANSVIHFNKFLNAEVSL